MTGMTRMVVFQDELVEPAGGKVGCGWRVHAWDREENWADFRSWWGNMRRRQWHRMGEPGLSECNFVFSGLLEYYGLTLEKAMAPHSSTLAWKIPRTAQSMGSLRVGHDWATSLSVFTSMHWRRKWQPTSVLAWRIPETGEPGGLPSMGLHRVRHDWSDLAAAAWPYIKLLELFETFFFSANRRALTSASLGAFWGKIRVLPFVFFVSWY